MAFLRLMSKELDPHMRYQSPYGLLMKQQRIKHADSRYQFQDGNQWLFKLFHT